MNEWTDGWFGLYVLPVYHPLWHEESEGGGGGRCINKPKARKEGVWSEDGRKMKITVEEKKEDIQKGGIIME